MLRKKTGMPLLMGLVVCSGVILFMICFTAAGAASEPVSESDRKTLEFALKTSIEAGYQDEIIETFLSIYHEDVSVVDYIYGKIGKETLKAKVLEDFDELSGQKVKIEILDASYEGESVIVLMVLSVKGSLENGRRANRHDRYYLDMKNGPTGWKIHRQGYRPDFSVTEVPHTVP